MILHTWICVSRVVFYLLLMVKHFRHALIKKAWQENRRLVSLIMISFIHMFLTSILILDHWFSFLKRVLLSRHVVLTLIVKKRCLSGISWFCFFISTFHLLVITVVFPSYLVVSIAISMRLLSHLACLSRFLALWV